MSPWRLEWSPGGSNRAPEARMEPWRLKLGTLWFCDRTRWCTTSTTQPTAGTLRVGDSTRWYTISKTRRTLVTNTAPPHARCGFATPRTGKPAAWLCDSMRWKTSSKTATNAAPPQAHRGSVKDLLKSALVHHQQDTAHCRHAVVW